MERIRYLDGWRGLAILGVVFAHFIGSDAINLGRLGVELFFVLSGRLMAEILFVRDTRLSYFFPRRFSRVWPTLFIFATTCLLITKLTALGDVTWQAWLAAVTFTYNYVSLLGVDSSWIEHSWTLCVEEHSYLLLGAIAFLSRRLNWPVLPILLVLALAAILNGMWQTWGLGLDYYQVYWRSDTRGASILLGAIVFLIWRDERFQTLTRFKSLSLMLMTVGIALNFEIVPDPIKYSLGSLCLAAALAGLGNSYEASKKFLTTDSLLFFGAISYSLYLWQQPFSKLIRYEDGPLIMTLSRFGLLLACILTAYFSYGFIEKPCRTGLNKAFARLGTKA